MSIKIEQGTIDGLGGTAVFAQQVTDYKAALAAHAKTTDQPAPIPPNSIVRAVVRDYNGDYEIYTLAPGETPPAPVDQRLDALKADPSRVDLLTRLKTATPADIDAYVANATLAQMRGIVAALLKLAATNLNTNR